MTTFAKDHLKAFVERIERLEEEKKSIADDIRDVYGEAKSTGFDVKALRAVIKIRKQDADERAEYEAILETYMHALGMLADTPLGEAAIDRAVRNSRRHLVEGVSDAAAVAAEAADAGFISQEAAAETADISRKVIAKFGRPAA